METTLNSRERETFETLAALLGREETAAAVLAALTAGVLIGKGTAA